MKIKIKITLLFIVISIIPLAISGVIVFQESQKAIQEEVFKTLKSTADSRKNDIDHLILLRQEDAKIISGTFLPKQLDPNGVNDPETIEKIQSHIDSIYSEITQLSKSGYDIIDKKTAIDIIGVWDSKGIIIANTNRELIGKKMPENFLEEVKQRGTYFAGFQKDPITKNNYLIILEEITNWDNGKFAGVMLLKVKAEILNEILSDTTGLAKTGEMFLVNSNQEMITQSRHIPDSIFNVKVDTDVARNCFSGQEFEGRYTNHRGEEVLGVSRFLSDQNWCMIGEVNVAEAFESVELLRNIFFVIIGSAAASILVLSTWVSGSISSPIRKIRNAALEISKGNLNVQTDVKSSDEIGDLSQSINQMAKTIRQNQDQIKEQLVELKKIDIQKDEFVAMISHELKTPMTPIKIFSSALMRPKMLGELNEKQKEAANAIHFNALRLERTVADLLDAQKLELGKMKFEKKEMKVEELMAQITTNLKSQTEEKGCQLINNTTEKNTIKTDSSRLAQVLTNLINNAIDFIPKDKGKIEINAQKSDDGILFSVKDNGIGMSQENQNKLFKKFFQTDTSVSRKHGGTGLGLAICKGIVEALGGKIWLESQEGKGTNFYFAIPEEENNENIDGR